MTLGLASFSAMSFGSFAGLGPDASFAFLGASQLAALVAGVAGLASALAHFVAESRGSSGKVASWISFAALGTFLAGLTASLIGVGFRWIEVNHWPVQSMFEALTMTAAALYVSFGVLYLALGMYRSKGTVRGLSDLFLALVMFGEYALLLYTQGQEKGPRSLPPALQSYWMAPHVSALLLSYVTLSIAYLACIIYFTLKLVRQFSGAAASAKPMSKAAMLGFLGFVFLPPFAQIVNIAVFLPVAGLGLLLSRSRKLDALDSWIDGFDQFSFRIFAIGFPFLTAGLMMGGFWAQEAWALYWGWDSKETSALISWLIYVVYVHLRFVAGWRGERSLWVILGGAISILFTFQLFGYLPASQDSLHRYTDGTSREGMELSAPSQASSGAGESPVAAGDGK